MQRAAPGADPLDGELLEEQVALALAQTQRVRLPHILFDIALTLIAWQAGAGWAALVYLPLMTIAQLGRSAWLARQRAAGVPAQRLRRDMQTLLALLGLIKALLTYAVLLQPRSEWQPLLTIVLLGYAAAAVATAGGDRNTYLSWVLPFSSGLVGGWMWQGGIEGLGMAVLVPVMLVVLADYVSDQGEAQRRLLRSNAALRAADTARTRFFAAAGHDLRQPLTALAYNAATVQALARLRPDPELATVADGLQRAISESQGLLDSLLELSRLDAGAVQAHAQPVDAGALLEELVAALAPQAEAARLQLRCKREPGVAAVLADPQLLRRVLKNLVGNAIKFTPPDGRVTLRLRAHDDTVIIEVSDTGPGIAAALQQQVFEPFFQAGNPGRQRSQGLGLGLAIVRRLVDLMGLQLQLDSAPGAGCHFRLRLPRATSAPPLQAADAPLPAPGLRLLLVDDEAAIREALSRFFATLGWELRSAADAQGADACLGDGWQPQALLLDLRLGDGDDGLALLERLRAQGCAAPAWLLTGDTAPERIRQAQAAGLPVRYKPVDGLALAAEISARCAETWDEGVRAIA